MQDVQNSKISVEKIGGTSMTAFGDVLRHIMLYDRSRIYGRIYVVSGLLGRDEPVAGAQKTGERGIYALFAEGKGYQDALANLATSLKSSTQATPTWACRWMWPMPLWTSALARPANTSTPCTMCWPAATSAARDVLLAAREVLASIGESHSAFNSVEILKANGVNAVLMDLAGFDDNEAWTIDERIAHSFKGLDLRQGGGGHRLHQGHRRHHARV